MKRFLLLLVLALTACSASAAGFLIVDRILPGSFLYRWKHDHALHHFRADEGNFGVTSLAWDYVFGTALTRTKKRKPHGA